MADVFCPTCHSRIGDDSGPVSELPRQQGILGTDINGNPVPRWSNDPVNTIDAFNGPDFQAPQRVLVTEIPELQEDRAAKEIEAGLTGSDLTVFSDSSIGSAREAIINELRESTEKILDANGSSLSEYFSNDADGIPATKPGPNDEFKSEWTDVSRGREWVHQDGEITGIFELPSSGQKESPSLPANTRIRAIHLEDLRRTLIAGWREFWSETDISFNTKENTQFFESDFKCDNGPNPIFTFFDEFREDFIVRTFNKDPFTKPGAQTTVCSPVGGGGGFICGESCLTETEAIFPTHSDGEIFPSDGGSKYETEIGTTIPPPNPEEEPLYHDGNKMWLWSSRIEDNIIDAGAKRSAGAPTFPGAVSTQVGSAVSEGNISATSGKLELVTSSVGTMVVSPPPSGGDLSQKFPDTESQIKVQHSFTQQPGSNRFFVGLPNQLSQRIGYTTKNRFRAKIVTEMDQTITADPAYFINNPNLNVKNSFAQFDTIPIGDLVGNPLNLTNFTLQLFGTFLRLTINLILHRPDNIELGLPTNPSDFENPIIDETTFNKINVQVSQFGVQTIKVDYERKFSSKEYTVDIAIEQLLKNVDAIDPFGYEPILLPNGDPNPNTRESLFDAILINMESRASGLASSFGVFESTADTAMTISEMFIDNTEKVAP